MRKTRIKSVCVVGSGFMGTQIGLQCAVNGCSVWMHDVSEAALKEFAEAQAALLDEQIDAGVAPPGERATIVGRIRATTSLSRAASEVDLVIEAVKEEVNVKRGVFRALDEHCPPGAILPCDARAGRGAVTAGH